MKSVYKNILLLASCLLLIIFACNKKATDYRKYLNGTEITYPGAVTNVQAFPGNGRLMLTWHPSPDPNVSKYVVYWNNHADSVSVNAISHNPLDTVKLVINNLNEYPYSFFINSYDAAGNKSVTSELDNARVYGAIYQSSLHNRYPNTDTPFVVNNDGSVLLKFYVPDTINITTNIKYTNATGTAAITSISPNNSSVTLPSYKSGTPVLYQSSYIPSTGAIDTFYTLRYDTFPTIYQLVQCDKSLFRKISYPTDMKPYQSSTDVEMLWNGSTTPQGWPDVYHSDGSGSLPGTVSFDMGKVYTNLNVMEEIGRNCCHNPNDFEVWGIADTTGAFPSLASNDPGWKAATIAKGWTLLTEATRNDDGSAPMRFNLISNLPPVRFIRVRFISTTDNSSYVNLTQLTFWNKQ